MKSKIGAAVLVLHLVLIVVAGWVGCTMDTSPPGAPTELRRITPDNDNTPIFFWDAPIDEGSGVSYYLVRVDAEAWQRVRDRTNCTWIPGLPDGTHRFEVRAVDKNGNEGESASMPFLCDTSPPPKTWLVSPVHWCCTDDATPLFDWGDVSDASGVTYWLEIDDDPDFSSPWLSMDRLGVSEYQLPEHQALADGKYFWRVCPVDGVGNKGEWTVSRSFTADGSAPGVPTTLRPCDGKHTNDNTPWLDWTDVTDATVVHYQLQVDDNTDFSSPVVSKTWVKLSSTTLPALPDGEYYWRVRAVDEANNMSAWSSIWSFTVDTVAPLVPTLTYPASGYNTADSTPWLDWTDVTDPSVVHYQVQVDDDADFSSPEISKTWVNSSSTTLSALPDGEYHWRVRAVDEAGNEGEWSDVWSFNIVTS